MHTRHRPERSEDLSFKVVLSIVCVAMSILSFRSSDHTSASLRNFFHASPSKAQKGSVLGRVVTGKTVSSTVRLSVLTCDVVFEDRVLDGVESSDTMEATSVCSSVALKNAVDDS